MPGVKPAPSEHHGNVNPHTKASDVAPSEDMMDMKLVLDLSESLFLFPESHLEPHGEETQRVGSSWSQDGDLQGCGQLERRWILWHEFMKEHAHLDAWLQLAEQAVTSFNSTCVTYIMAKEELRKFERLRCEAGSRLVQLDSLARKNRTLTQLFQGVMQARLLAAARECGQRWDDVNTKLESTIRRLQLFASEWEEFEAEGEELALWLADLDVRLTEVDHLNGSTCEKLRRLQSFQQCVCVNSSRVNALLQRGEELIQHSELTDAQHVESRLLELLRRCSHIYSNIARTHTRLLSMRLVFEDDWLLSQATDSGCPSESLLEEEGVLNKSNLELPATANCPKDLSRSVNPTLALPSDPPSPVRPPAPPAPSSPTHEHQGLEWDPSVDIGRSVSCDDADSSYFSASTGVCHRDGLKRRSYLSSLGSQSDFSSDAVNRDADLVTYSSLAALTQPEGRVDHALSGVFSPVATTQDGELVPGDQWMTSTPDGQDGEPVSFNSGRVRAWLGVQSPALPEGRTSCSKAVQTDGECCLDGSCIDKPINSQRHSDDDTQWPFPAPSPSSGQDLKASDCISQNYPSDLQDSGTELNSCFPRSDAAKHPHTITLPPPCLTAESVWWWFGGILCLICTRCRVVNTDSDAEAEEEPSFCEDSEHLSEQSVTSSSRASSSLLSSPLLYLLLAAALAVLACLIWVTLEPPCHRSSRMHRSFHLALRYINGPPPT